MSPTSKLYSLHPAAQSEIETVYSWYLDRSTDAAAAFLATLNEGLEAVCAAPERFPKYFLDTRRYILRKFPFSIVYLNDPDGVKIVAISHHKRKPGYWEERL